MAMSNLSGKDWWRKNQAGYPNGREIDDLEPRFRSRLEDFVGSLTTACSAALKARGDGIGEDGGPTFGRGAWRLR